MFPAVLNQRLHSGTLFHVPAGDSVIAVDAHQHLRRVGFDLLLEIALLHFVAAILQV